MEQSFLDTILRNLAKYSTNNAFFINEQFYTYADLTTKIAGIHEAIKTLPKQTCVGVVTTDTIDTYASIIALWFNELIFVPISPANAKDRNQNSIKQADVKHVLTTTEEDVKIIDSSQLTVIVTADLFAKTTLKNNNTNPNNNLYVLFTSGSTGTPKGVPINLKNLDAFVHSFLSIGFELNEKDRCLQIYDLSFDASVHCYVLPLFLGACVYTVPPNAVKYLYAYKLMKTQALTFAKMPPSTITYLQPYFATINLPHLKYILFGGEALQQELVSEWKKCVPTTEIYNVYGPTEATINCFSYKVDQPKSYNNVVAIGKPMNGVEALVLDEQHNGLGANKKGELCVAGHQITTGYWSNETKNKAAFVEIAGQQYYKTGDLVYVDDEGIYFYCERKDNQVQIQGYRVELGELEQQVRLLTNLNHVVAIAKANKTGINQLHLFLENFKGEIEQLKTELAKKVPQYMLPQQILTISSFPLTTSGKIDRNQLKELLK